MAVLALGLSSLASAYGGLQARKQQSKLRKQQEAARQRTLGLQGLYGDLSFSQLQSGLSTLGQGFDRARSEASALGQAARQRVADQSIKDRGRAEQNLLNTGFDRSNLASQVDRSLAADTLRRNQEIDQGLAQLYSQLAVNRAQSEAGMRQAMSAQLQGQGDRLAGLEQYFAGNALELGTTSFEGPQYDFSSLFELYNQYQQAQAEKKKNGG